MAAHKTESLEQPHETRDGREGEEEENENDLHGLRFVVVPMINPSRQFKPP